MDQVSTQDQEARSGLQFIDCLDCLFCELDLLSPFIPSWITVTNPPSLHQAKLGIRCLDEVKGPVPLLLFIWEGQEKIAWGWQTIYCKNIQLYITPSKQFLCYKETKTALIFTPQGLQHKYSSEIVLTHDSLRNFQH